MASVHQSFLRGAGVMMQVAVGEVMVVVITRRQEALTEVASGVMVTVKVVMEVMLVVELVVGVVVTVMMEMMTI